MNSSTALTGSFFRGVGMLASGTVLAQVILLTAMPVLTRLFTPSQFGEVAVFTSVGAIAALISTGRYEYAIALPGTEEEARGVTWLVILAGIGMGVIYELLVLGMRVGADLMPGQALPYVCSPWALLVPIYTILAATLSGFQYWQLRHKRYAAMTYSNMGQSILSTLINLLAGHVAIEHGLIYGLLGGLLAAIATLLITGVRFSASLPSRALLLSLARRYSAFPRYSIAGDLAAGLSQNIIPLMFAFAYTPYVVGLFAVANRVLRIPSIVFTNSIGNVFRNEAMEAINSRGSCNEIYQAARRKLIFLGGPCYLVMSILSPWAFGLVLGPEWVEAGRFARWICVLAAVEFVAMPLNTLFYIRGAQKTYMWLQFGNVVSCVAAASAAHASGCSPLNTLKWIVGVGAVYSFGMLWATQCLSERRGRG